MSQTVSLPEAMGTSNLPALELKERPSKMSSMRGLSRVPGLVMTNSLLWYRWPSYFVDLPIKSGSFQ